MGALSKYLQKNIPTLKPRVTCLLLKNNRVLLGQKKEGIGRGNYISIGGKPIRGESLVQAARREVQEEIGVLIEDVYRVADLEFYFTKTKDWNQKLYVYACHCWKGQIRETEEVKPEWFDINLIPYDRMWGDARFYMPHVVNGMFVKAQFLYNSRNNVIDCNLNARQIKSRIVSGK